MQIAATLKTKGQTPTIKMSELGLLLRREEEKEEE